MKKPGFFPILILISIMLLAACQPAGSAGEQATATISAATPTTAVEPTAAATVTTAASATAEATATMEVTATVEVTATAASGGASGDDNTLTAIRAVAAPELDGAGDDTAWADAPEIVIDTAGGANESDTQVTVKAMYDDENVYFLLTWADPTQSVLRNPWELQQDGTWKKLSSPENKGGDENEFYEDKISFIWSIDNSIENFETTGCFTACHTGENSDVKPYGNKYTKSPEERGDIWHWKSVRNVSQVDDQYLDNTPYSAENPNAGRKSDPGEGGYVDNQSEDKSMPGFMVAEGGEKTGEPGFILDEDKVPFDASLFSPGDRVPSVIAAPFTGDRGNLSAGWAYADGTWTLEISRPLTTDSELSTTLI